MTVLGGYHTTTQRQRRYRINWPVLIVIAFCAVSWTGIILLVATVAHRPMPLTGHPRPSGWSSPHRVEDHSSPAGCNSIERKGRG